MQFKVGYISRLLFVFALISFGESTARPARSKPNLEGPNEGPYELHSLKEDSANTVMRSAHDIPSAARFHFEPGASRSMEEAAALEALNNNASLPINPYATKEANAVAVQVCASSLFAFWGHKQNSCDKQGNCVNTLQQTVICKIPEPKSDPAIFALAAINLKKEMMDVLVPAANRGEIGFSDIWLKLAESVLRFFTPQQRCAIIEGFLTGHQYEGACAHVLGAVTGQDGVTMYRKAPVPYAHVILWQNNPAGDFSKELSRLMAAPKSGQAA